MQSGCGRREQSDRATAASILLGRAPGGSAPKPCGARKRRVCGGMKKLAASAAKRHLRPKDTNRTAETLSGSGRSLGAWSRYTGRAKRLLKP